MNETTTETRKQVETPILVEHERRDHPVDEEVVPFDSRADSRRDNSANRVPSMLFVRTLHQPSPFFAANRVAGLR